MGMIKEYCRDERGNFTMMFSLVGTVLLGGVMLAVDVNKMYATKSKVSALTDAAALAGATSFNQSDREDVVLRFLEENGHKMLPAKFSGNPEISFNDDARSVNVNVATTVNTPFAKVFGFNSVDVGYDTTAVYQGLGNPLTIAFALDTSGSMGDPTKDGIRKIDALKDSVSSMFQVIETKAGSYNALNASLRTGVSAFNSELTEDFPMSWGFKETEQVILDLNPDGLTNSGVALENAYKQILNDRDVRAKSDVSFKLDELDEYVIFMTDGANTFGDPILIDEESYETCLAMREDGIEVYAVAFTAPEEGQLLLMDCASWDDTIEDKQSKNVKNRGKKCGRRGNGNGNGNGANNGNGKGWDKRAAVAKCRNEVLESKREHYFDADDAKSFEEVFKQIGKNIKVESVRIL